MIKDKNIKIYIIFYIFIPSLFLECCILFCPEMSSLFQSLTLQPQPVYKYVNSPYIIQQNWLFGNKNKANDHITQ